ncbi:hypothetical protein BH11MYX3_BH11MYX3_25920 [soil metagenome]
MPFKRCLYVVALAGCSISTSNPSDPGSPPDGDSPAGEGTSSLAVPDIQCAATPDLGPAGELRHTRSALITALGSPRHRGLDLVSTPSAARQVLAGAISYTLADKALEDEDVELFACVDGAWSGLGDARTDDEGRFALALEGSARLEIGMRDLYVSVVGDRTGARFLAYIAPPATRMVASDVDGTLTSSESTFVKTVVVGSESLAQPGAATAFRFLAERGYQPVYITARGQQFVCDTRAWLAEQDFPRGPMMLAPSFITIPGGDTVDFKAGAMATIRTAGLVIAAGIGNRASDVAAYVRAGLEPERIFIGTTEFADELAPDLEAGRATGFATYDELRADRLTLLP